MIKNVDLNRILLFTRIVEAGNISRAASQLGETKAKLSRSLAALEADLGLQLVYRTTRQFHLTDTGERFYQEAKSRVDGLVGIVEGLRTEDREISGLIRLTAPADIGVSVVNPIVDDFIKLHPRTEFDLIYTNDVLDLVKLGVDVAVRAGNLRDSSLIQKKAGTITSILVASPKYLARYKALTEIEQLNEHRTIGFAPLNTRLSWEIHSAKNKKTLRLKHTHTANNGFVIRDLAVAGHGIAFIPRFACEPYLSSGDLVHVLRGWSHPGAPIQVAVPHQKKLPNKIRAFFDFTVKNLGQVF